MPQNVRSIKDLTSKKTLNRHIEFCQADRTTWELAKLIFTQYDHLSRIQCVYAVFFCWSGLLWFKCQFINNNVEKDSTLLLFFLSKSPPGGNAISRPKHLELFHIGNADGRPDGRTVTWLQKFLGWMNYQIFSGMGLRSRLREAPPS